MNSNLTVIILIVIRLEKLKQKTWVLIVLARALVFLALIVTCYLRQS
jgi:hypothetical protein